MWGGKGGVKDSCEGEGGVKDEDESGADDDVGVGET